jgi:hypothetical protein
MNGMSSYPDTRPRDVGLFRGAAEVLLDILDLLDIVICIVVCFLEAL